MKALVALAALLLVSAAAAQPADSSGGARRERAPLANDIDPAVDVGASRVAVIDRPAAPKPAVSKPAPPAPPSKPSVAAPTRVPTPVAAVPADTKPGAQAAPRAGNTRILDSLDLGTTSITGNQELPKVLYIVPWKKSDLGDLVGRPVNTLLDEVLAPVDPEVFERHLEYYEALYGQGEKE